MRASSRLGQPFGQKKGVFPEYILDSTSAEGESQDESVCQASGSSKESTIERTEHQKKKTTLEKVFEAIEEKKHFQDEVLSFLKESQRRKEEIAERKIQLLEKILEKLE